MATEIVVALIGNPNSGKTTVFNNLTGGHQHVGNWPGVTVERKEGRRSYVGRALRIVDLPGVYGLTAYSLDELIARNFVVDECPDVTVDVIDASNLERNLYLAVQLLEVGANLVVALNMMDVAKSRRYRIDVAGLSKHLGAPVVPVVASRNEGTEQLLHEVVHAAERKAPLNEFRLTYGRELDEEMAKLGELISGTDLAKRYSAKWLAIKLLEEDEEVVKKFREAAN